MPEYLYVRSNPEWENKFKFGYTSTEKGLVDRYLASITEHSDYSSYENIFEIKKEKYYSQEYREFDKILSIACRSRKFSSEYPLLDSFYPFLIEGRVRNEFMKKEGLETLEKIVKEEFPKLGLSLIKSFSRDECNEVVEKAKSQISEDDKQPITKDNFELRDYQTKIIEDLQSYLLKDGRAFLELATGGGKSFIVYNLFKIIKSKCIIIFSPRKKINSQNIDEKYVSMLEEKLEVIHCDNLRKSKYERSIIVSCVQSVEKIYRFIQDSKLHDIFVWFDEAHHTIENWRGMKEEKEYIKFFLSDQERIKYRIFTSASPNKDFVKENKKNFGNLCSLIKVKKLIDDGWLCPVSCRILTDNLDSLNYSKLILQTFSGNKKNFGFSFHSRENNAYNLFIIHFDKFKRGETDVKPFLLISFTGLNQEYKKKLKSIDLDYDFIDIDVFEKNRNCISYVVKKYDMGYDFKYLDFISITDSKMSHKDIIQCIGRGTRSDCLGDLGKNKEKNLLVVLPVSLEELEKQNYKNVVEVLKYLVHDIEIDILDCFIRKDSGPGESGISKTYEGDCICKTKLLDLLIDKDVLKKINTKSLIKICINHKIFDDLSYNLFKNSNTFFKLKPSVYNYPGFFWKDVLDPEGKLYYETKKECLERKTSFLQSKKVELDKLEFKKLLISVKNNGFKSLNKYDKRFPPCSDLDKYYPS